MKTILLMTIFFISTISAEEITFYFADTAKAERVKLDFEEESVFSRGYAHNGVYIVKDNKIIFRSFDYLPTTFSLPLKNDSGLVSTCFLHIKKDVRNDYMLIFTFFKDGTLKYYVFKDGSKDYLINTLNITKLSVPDDASITVSDVDLETNKYSINIKIFEKEVSVSSTLVLE